MLNRKNGHQNNRQDLEEIALFGYSDCTSSQRKQHSLAIQTAPPIRENSTLRLFRLHLQLEKIALFDYSDCTSNQRKQHSSAIQTAPPIRENSTLRLFRLHLQLENIALFGYSDCTSNQRKQHLLHSFIVPCIIISIVLARHEFIWTTIYTCTLLSEHKLDLRAICNSLLASIDLSV